MGSIQAPAQQEQKPTFRLEGSFCQIGPVQGLSVCSQALVQGVDLSAHCRRKRGNREGRRGATDASRILSTFDPSPSVAHNPPCVFHTPGKEDVGQNNNNDGGGGGLRSRFSM